MRTKVTVKQVRSPIAALNATLMKAKLDDADDFLDALGAEAYTAAGAISPNVGLAFIDCSVPRQAMTLADGTIAGEQILLKLRDLSTVAAVDVALDTLTIDNHQLATEDGPFWISSSTNQLPGGLHAETPYYVIALNAYQVQLAVSDAAAALGTAIDLTSVGGGDITLTRVTAVSAVTFGADTLTSVGHGFVTGDGPVQIVSTLLVPAPLAKGTEYYLIRVDDDTLKVATSSVNALAGTAVNLSDNGTGDITLQQLSYRTVAAANGSARVAPANFTAGTYLDLDDEGDRARLIWSGTAWAVKGTGTATRGGELTSVGHGLATGDGPFYIAATVTIPTGLAALTPYWFIRLTADKFLLASSEDNANGLIPVNVTAAGAGTITLTRLIDVEAVDNATEELLATAHAIPDEATVRIEALPAGVIPTGLLAATTYYAIVGVDPDILKLATSQPNAAAETAIDITTDGTLPLRLMQLAYKTITAIDPVPVS